MKSRTSSPNRSNVRTFIVSLLAYVLLTGQLAPLAMAANAKLNRAANRRAPISYADESSGAAQPISNETHFLPVPKPLAQPAVPIQPLAVNIVATKTDNRTVAQPAAPGDTINYTVVIQNLGSTDATNVTFTDTIDANTTLVPNSIVSTPVANNDTYNVVGNVRIQPNAAQGLLTNDFNPDNGNATGITASGPATSTQGGNVTISADGSFSYNPPAGFAGTDTFTYTLTVTATGKTDTATVTLNVGNGTATPGTNVIWFINSAAAPGGDGRLTSPFNCFVGAGCFSAIAADDPGDTIFLYAAAGAYSGGYTLLANQKLIGQGASATLASISGVTVQAYSDALPVTSGNPATVTITTSVAATNAVTLGAGNTLRGFTIGNTTGAKILGSGFGTLIVGNNASPDVVLNGSGQALNLTTGTLSVTGGFSSVATTSSGTQGIVLAGIADSDGAGGGAFSFGSTTVSGNTTQGIQIGTTTADLNLGNTSVTGGSDAISLQNNSAGTRTFGTVTTSGNSGIGFLHSAAGGLTSVTGTTTITNPGGTGISIQNSTTAISFAGTTVNKGATAGTGVDLGNNSGNTTFNSLSITTLNGTGLFGVGNTGQINVTTNAGSIASTNGPAINITKAAPPATPVTLNFTSVSSNNSLATGLTLDRVSGNATIGTTTTTNPAGVGISVTNTSAGGTMNFGNTTSNLSAGTGVNLGTNSGAVTFVDLDIAPDAAVAAFILANSPGTTTSSSGTISTTDAPAISVTSSPLAMTLTSVSADNTGDPDSCVSLTTASGTLIMQGGTLIGGTGAVFLVSGGNPTVTYSGSITQNSAGRVVDIQGTTGNTITFNTGTITGGASNLGVHIADTTAVSGNVTFSNGLTLGTSIARMTNQAVTIGTSTGTFNLGAVSIFTNNVSGVVATNADGTLNCASGTVDSSGARAINIDGPVGLTTLGMTLTRVDSTGGTANGIRIQDTNGSFTITGTGGTCTNANTAGCSGGTIASSTGADDSSATPIGTGVVLNNATNVSLTRMWIHDHSNYGIRGTSVTGFTLDTSVLNGTNGTDAPGSAASPFNEGTIKIDNLAGAATISNTHISGGISSNVRIVNTSTTVNRVTFTNDTIGANSTNNGEDGILLESENTGRVLATIQTTIFTSARGDLFNFVDNAASGSADDLIFNNNTLSNNHPAIATGGGGVTISSNGTKDFTFHMENNTMRDAVGHGVLLVKSTGTASYSGTFTGNTIGLAATANSGSREGSALKVQSAGQGTLTVAITNNQIHQYNNNGIELLTGGGASPQSGAFNATITGNTIDTPGNTAGTIAIPKNGIHLNGGTVVGDTFAICAQIGGAGALANSIATSGKDAVPATVGDIDFRLRQRQATTVRLPGYAGANNNDAAVVTFVAGNNGGNGAPVGLASNTVPTGGGFVGGAACTAPTTAPPPSELIVDAMPNDVSVKQPTQVGDGISQPVVAPPVVTQISAPNISYSDRLIKDISSPQSDHSSIASGIKAGAAGAKSPTKDLEKNLDTPKGITPSLANFPLTIGTLGAGKSVTITFSVTVNNPVPPGTTQVSNQGTISGNDGATPFNVLTDDPDVAGTNNPTVTGITPPPDINIKDATVAEPASGTASMLFAVNLSAPATGPVSVNFATANGGATPATGGTCSGGADYEITNGTVNFIAGQQIQTIAIPVCSDAAVEGDETFLVNLSTPTNGIISDGQATGTITVNTPGTLLISELRTSGPSGSADEFVEVYNNTNSPHVVAATNGSTGYGVFKSGADCNSNPVLVGTIPNGTTIPARGHYLLVGAAYSLANYGGTGAAAGNLTMSSDIENDRNVSIFSTTNVLALSTTTRFDAVGFSTNTGNICDLQREGTNLGALLGSTLQYSFFRKLDTGTPQDTNDNAADFLFVDTAATLVAGAGQHLGAPGPENLASPLQRNTTIKASLVDPGVSSTAAPNRVRDLTADPANNSTLGTLDIRRKFTNNTGAAVTRLRFRIVDITTAPPPGGTADLRARTSTQLTGVAVSGGGTVTLDALTLETPPAQAMGGGYNSTLSAGTVTLATPLAAGASLNFRFLLGVQQNGSFRFFINVEALP